VGRSQAV